MATRRTTAKGSPASRSRPGSPSDASPSDTSPRKAFADRRRDRDVKREAVLKAAVRLFLDQGYDRASMNEVALQLNITKPALYNYFRGKDAILLECYRLGQEMVEAALARIDAEAMSGLEKVRAFIRAYTFVMTEDFGMCFSRLDDRVLTPDDRAGVRAAKRRIDLTVRGYIAAGVADGSITPCDPKLATFAILGALNWIGQWYREGGSATPEALGEAFSARLTEGLAAHAVPAVTGT